MNEIAIGTPVVYVDPTGVERPALVTAVWGKPEDNPSINVVFVSENDAETDGYGRQIKRETSIVHESMQYAHGRFWKMN